MEFKFKVGDKIKYIGLKHYNFYSAEENIAKKGDTYIISSRGISKYGAGTIYSVKGCYCEDKPNWHYMEEEFEKVECKSWKERLQ